MLSKLLRQAYAAASLVDRMTGRPEPEEWLERRRKSHEIARSNGRVRPWLSWEDTLLPQYQEPPKKKVFKTWTATYPTHSGTVTIDHLASSELAYAISNMRYKLHDMHAILGHEKSC